MKWYEFALKRLIFLIPMLFVVSIFVFTIIHMIPGSPAHAMIGIRTTPERIAALEEELGLNKPLIIQYKDWLFGLLTGDWGTSYTYDKPVFNVITDRFWVTFEQIVLATIVATLLSIPMGIISALNQNTLIDYFTMSVGIIGVSIPMYFSGVVFIAVFGVWLGLFPTSGYVPPSEDIVENLRHMVLPVLTLTLPMLAITFRMMRSSMIETLREDYIQFLKAKGLIRRWILFGHALKNSFIPVITILGLSFGYLLASAVLVEEVFAIPGLGRTIVQAVLQRDFPLVQGVMLLLAVWFVTVNLVTDLIVGYLDPRIMEDME